MVNGFLSVIYLNNSYRMLEGFTIIIMIQLTFGIDNQYHKTVSILIFLFVIYQKTFANLLSVFQCKHQIMVTFFNTLPQLDTIFLFWSKYQFIKQDRDRVTFLHINQNIFQIFIYNLLLFIFNLTFPFYVLIKNLAVFAYIVYWYLFYFSMSFMFEFYELPFVILELVLYHLLQ